MLAFLLPKILTAEGLLACGSWGALRELIIHGNPLTRTARGNHHPLILLLDPSSFSSSLLNPSFPLLSLLPSFPSLSLLSSYPFSTSLFSPPPLPSFPPLSSSSSSFSSFLPQHTGMPPLLQTHLVDQNGISVVRYVYMYFYGTI